MRCPNWLNLNCAGTASSHIGIEKSISKRLTAAWNAVGHILCFKCGLLMISVAALDVSMISGKACTGDSVMITHLLVPAARSLQGTSMRCTEASVSFNLSILTGVRDHQRCCRKDARLS